MTRLSSPITEMKPHYEVVVIGSGYGGSIAASRMARAGRQVCLLERGKEIVPGDFPDTLIEGIQETQVNNEDDHIGDRTGLYRYDVNDDMSVLSGCGLGGTSLINANVAIEPDGRVFEDERWPQAFRDDVGERLEKGYEDAKEMLKPIQYPDIDSQENPDEYPRPFPPLPKLDALEKSAEEMGENFYRLEINVNFELEGQANHVGVRQEPCELCGDCMAGCNHLAKNTTYMNYIPDARNHEAQIFTQVEVRHIEKEGDQWVVHCQLLHTGSERFSGPTFLIRADILVLGAGTMGTNEILLRSKRAGLPLSDHLGQHFSGNADVGGGAYNSDQVINPIGLGQRFHSLPPVGPTITGAIDIRGIDDLEESMIIEDGAIFSPIAHLVPKSLFTAALLSGEDMDQGILDRAQEIAREVDGLTRGPYRGAANHTQVFLVMAHDDSGGRLHLEDDRIRIDWPGIGDQPFVNHVNERLEDATRALGGTFIENPFWENLPTRNMATAHPLGGCIMAEDAGQGVVDHKGRVFAGDSGTAVHEGLYVCDASVIPRTLGANPLLTISAIAERTMALLAEDNNWTIDYEFGPVVSEPAEPEVIGVQFSERMKGYFSSDIKDDFKAGWDVGQASGSEFEFIVTIQIEDMGTFMSDPNYTSKFVGTVTAPELSPNQLVATRGDFNLAVSEPDDPARVRRMKYRMLLTAKDGKKFFFDGFKIIRDDPGFDLWEDTTTLYITVYEGENMDGPVIGKGILRVTPDDFQRQSSTMTILHARSKREELNAMAQFGRYFSGTLYDIYAGVFAGSSLFDPDAPPRRKRPLRTLAPEVHFFTTEDGLQLRLTRYQGGDKGPVMLVHGLGVSSLAFSIDTIDTNMTEYLFENGYDVWLLDYRSSIELPYADTPYTADDVARYDWPAAVETVKAITGADSVQAVVHCYGAITWTMAMLAGLEGVRSAVCSQVGAHINVIPSNRLRAGLYLDGLLEMVGVENLTMYTDEHDNWLDRLYNRALKLNPIIAKEEQCNNPVCHRVTFLYAPLYEHDQLNNATHAVMHELFGVASMDNFAHLGELTRADHLVNADGREEYLPHVDRMAIPIAFIHGEENETWLPKSTVRTVEWLSENNGDQLYTRHVIPDYGHIDCIFGKDASKDVYPHILDHLEKTL